MSLPSRERGLKFVDGLLSNIQPQVAPLAGAWIEIIYQTFALINCQASLPSRERGLKYGAIKQYYGEGSRSPRGSVD